ncbi:hypothetical protein 3 [Wenling tombus-like virus 3]|uniref:hypothetical protein 3 n=1 Tax=Wenling tombus-like virus 3 TaxID=1923545 RepID=UPI00090CA40A|nr:hypothetical protein 3 [Wenling tombus-like virus 3]APG76592.1 hypothetical protein 3 [Wenling tombus-like virus 3]
MDVHHNCVGNAYIALRDRHMVPFIENMYLDDGSISPDRSSPPYVALLNESRRLARRWKRECVPERLTLKQALDHFLPKKGAVYRTAYKSLINKPLEYSDSFVSMFVKDEKVPNIAKPPRAIQYRSARYNLELGRFLIPVEDCYGSGCFSPVGERVFSKGLNRASLSILFSKVLSKFKDPVVIENDYSRYDSRINRALLMTEHAFYLELFGLHRKLAKLLNWQLNNRGRHRDGVKYRTKGRRMSGDYNTGLGNSILNLLILRMWMFESGIEKYHLIVDGDDSLLVIERGDVSRVFPDYSYVMFGIPAETKIVEPYGCSFCQMFWDGHWFVSDFRRRLHRLSYVIRPSPPVPYLNTIMLGTLYSEFAHEFLVLFAKDWLSRYASHGFDIEAVDYRFSDSVALSDIPLATVWDAARQHGFNPIWDAYFMRASLRKFVYKFAHGNRTFVELGRTNRISDFCKLAQDLYNHAA